MRLSARYRHFWARGKYYQRFWANSGDALLQGQTLTTAASLISGAAAGNASASGALLSAPASLIAGNATGAANALGATIVINGSIIPGTLSTDNNLAGQTLTAIASLIPGSTAQDASAPLNTRLNARYRHFWNRRQRWRHFWAQWEGEGISSSLADGDLVVASLAIVLNGDVSGDANWPGFTGLEVAASIISGEAHGAAHSDGVLYTVTALLPDAIGMGQELIAQASIPSAVAIGTDLEAQAEIIPGEAIVPPNALAIGEPLPPVIASVISGAAQSGVFVDGHLIEVQASLPDAQSFAVELDVQASVIEGALETDNYLDGQVLAVGVSIIEGAATGEIVEASPGGMGSVRGMPPAFRHEKSRDHAEAFGDLVSVGAQLIAGVASVEHATAIESFAKRLPSARVAKQGFEAVVKAPTAFSIPREASGTLVSAELSLLPGIASADASASGAVIEDWLANDERDLADLDFLHAA